MERLMPARSHRALTPLIAALALAACVAPGRSTIDVSPQQGMTGPKVVAVMGTRNEVVAALEDAMSEHGFTFRHYVSRERVTEPIGQVRMGENVSENTKYALQVTTDVFDKCMGGGFALASLTVSVVDRSSNQLMFRASAKGRTEKCPPVSGRIFHDIANAIDAAWQR